MLDRIYHIPSWPDRRMLVNDCGISWSFSFVLLLFDNCLRCSILIIFQGYMLLDTS